MLQIFYSVWKETTCKHSKVVAAKTFFSKVYVAGTTCLDECIISHMITSRYYFL